MCRIPRVIGVWSFVLLLAVGLMATGCGAVKSYGKHLQSSFTSPSVPKALDASLEETGVLLAEVRLYGKGLLGEYGYDLVAASIASPSAPADVITAGTFSKNLVVFQGLRPGTYNLVQFSGSRNAGANMEYVKPVLGPDAIQTVTIGAGEAVYLGTLNYGMLSGGKTAAEWVADPAAEAKAWSKLRDRYDDSPWTPVITQRITALEAPTD